jgi:hypothetical protein
MDEWRVKENTDIPAPTLVSSKTHAQPDEKDPMDESVEVEGGCGREGKRRALQHYSTYVPDKARVEGEREYRYPCTHDL